MITVLERARLVWTSLAAAEVHRVHMELGGKLLNFLRIIKTQFFERLQSVSVVDGAAHTQKDNVKSPQMILVLPPSLGFM